VNAAERVDEVLARFRRALSFEQAILIAASEARGKPLDPRRPGDAAVILHAETLLEQGATVRDAIDQARTDAEAAGVALSETSARRTRGADGKPSLDEVLCDPRLRAVIGVGAVTTTAEASDEQSGLVLLERHEIGPHAIEVWGPPAEPPREPNKSPSPTGRLIDTCTRCRAPVGDNEWTFGAWDGKDWRFSGRTLPGAKRVAALRPLLCCDCAVRVKFKMIPPPPVPRGFASDGSMMLEQRWPA
jgi:hypothetical protein